MPSEVKRESSTSAWKRRGSEESSWSAKELAQLCCGWDPDREEFPDSAAYNRALNKILRGIRAGDLPTIPLNIPASREELFYGDAPLFRPHEVADWATRQFPTTFAYRDWKTLSDDKGAATQSAQRRKTNKAERKTLGKQIEKLRLEKRMSIEELADSVGLDKSTVGRHLRGESQIRAANLRRYEEVFLCKLDAAEFKT